MARGRIATRRRATREFWPGYVDVLSTLLLVVTFLMSIFMLAQYFASQEASGKDTALRRLTRQITELTNLLSLEKGKGKSAEDELAALQASLATLKDENTELSGSALSGDERRRMRRRASPALSKPTSQNQKNISNEALAKVDLLNQQLLALRRQIAALQEALEASEKQGRGEPGAHQGSRRPPQRRARPPGAGAAALPLRLLRAPARAAARTARTSASSATASCSSPRCCSPRARRPDARRPRRHGPARGGHRRARAPHPPGDRLGAAGRRPHRHPADRQPAPSRPTGSCRRARAISVVSYLISAGVSPKRLVAAGYGEFQPLEHGTRTRRACSATAASSSS